MGVCTTYFISDIAKMEKNAKIIAELGKRLGNSTCADCRSKGKKK